MSDEHIDPYLIHSDVFPSSDETTSNDGKSLQNSIDFLVGLKRPAHVDEDGDMDLDRPERIHLTLGISSLPSTFR